MSLDESNSIKARRRSEKVEERGKDGIKEEQMVLHDYVMPKAAEVDSSIMRPTVEAHNFKFKLALVTFMERDLFGEHPSENPICIFVTSLRNTTQLN